MKKKSFCFLCGLLELLAGNHALRAQGSGDQFLDGIGETALVARYVFRGSERDSSRHGRHANLAGEGGGYVRDARFGRVLALPGSKGAFVQIPGSVLEGLDTISLAGWIQVTSNAPGCIFDFGANTLSNLFCSSVEGITTGTYRVGITTNGPAEAQGLLTLNIPPQRWAHLAVVLDAANKTMSGYVDGVKAAQIGNVQLTVDHVLRQNDVHSNYVFVGRSQDESAPRLNALVHDLRIYSIALTEQQVAEIRSNRLAESELASTSFAANQARQTLAGSGIAQPMAEKLIGVSDVTVETSVGNLPRLPYALQGKYRDKAQVPAVRVIWPSSTNNQQVLTAGVYTVVGKVPGTEVPAKATVRVKEASKKVSLPARQLLGNLHAFLHV